MEFLAYYIIVALIASMITGVLALNSDAFDGIGFAWLNPVWLYNTIKVNWFGAAFLALIGNLALPLYAICYWIYKLCTVGRR